LLILRAPTATNQKVGSSSPPGRTTYSLSFTIASLHPLIVVAGHKRNSGLPDNPAALAFTRQYITDFDSTRKSASNADQVIAAMKQKYPQCSSEYFLMLSARKAFAN
jgi:hypothetical protein